jgi:prepilin-type N-terminal cleavage/methylation domain-containing protein
MTRSSWFRSKLQSIKNTLSLQKIYRSEDGFTLVEMAISMAIIGLLLGAMLKGEELYKQMQVRRLMADINSVTAAIKGFQDRYGSLPGDFPLANRRLANCSAGTFCRNGNGDSRVGRFLPWPGSGWNCDQSRTNTMAAPHFYDETSQFWKHLALAGFLKNIHPGANPANPAWNQTHPGTPIGGGFTIFTDTQGAGSAISIRYQTVVSYGGAGACDAVDPPFRRPFTVMQGQFLDVKYDDGRAAAGYVWGIPFAGVSDPACRVGAGQYNLANAHDNLCQEHFILH